MSSFAVHLSSDYADARFGENGCLFYLNPSLTLPSRKHEFLLAVTTASIPLSYYVINSQNNLLQLIFNDEIVNIAIREGNRSIEEVLEILNEELVDGFVAEYLEPTNRIALTTETPGRDVTIGPQTTCQRLLGRQTLRPRNLPMKRGIAVDLSEVNNSIAELEAKHDVDTEILQTGLAATDSNMAELEIAAGGLSNAAAAADALSSLEDDIVALSNFAHECCETAESNFATLSKRLAAIDTSSYIPQSEKSRFIVDLVEPFAIGAHAGNGGRIDVYGTLRNPLGPLFDIGEATNPWREVYAEGLTLSDTSNLKSTHFQGAEGDFNLDDVIEYALSLAAPAEHPTIVTLAQINEVENADGIIINGDLLPRDINPGFPPLARVGNLTYPFLEGHFTNLFAGNIYGIDEGGSTRRVLLEGDAAATPQWITDLQGDVSISGFNLDVDFTGPQGPAGADGADGADAVLPSWVASSQSAIPLSGFANDLALTADNVEWANVLNKPTFFQRELQRPYKHADDPFASRLCYRIVGVIARVHHRGGEFAFVGGHFAKRNTS
eukprot:jgi/Tetstr1/432616/TSEL_021985.t1